MELNHSQANLFIPDGVMEAEAFPRTTHLGIGAHQDDLEIFAYHGIAECLGRENQWFGGVVVTNGAGSPRAGIYEDYTDEQMQAVRFREQRKAAFVGEYAFQAQLGYSSPEVKDARNPYVRNDLQAILESAQPEIVYLHNPADKHDTHIAVLQRSLESIRALPLEKRPRKAYGCEVWRDLDWMPDEQKQVLNVNTQSNIAASLVGVFDSQISGGKRYDLAVIGRRLANATFFASHHTDDTNAITFAMDLTPLLWDDSLSLEVVTLGMIDSFRADVKRRLRQFIVQS